MYWGPLRNSGASVATVACVCTTEDTFIHFSRSQSHVLLQDILRCLGINTTKNNLLCDPVSLWFENVLQARRCARWLTRFHVLLRHFVDHDWNTCWFMTAEGDFSCRRKEEEPFRQSSCSHHRCQTSYLKSQLLKKHQIKESAWICFTMTVRGQYSLGCFTLLECSKVFRSLLLNLPKNPKCGKTWARHLPSRKVFFVLFFLNQSFPDKTLRFSVGLSVWLWSPPVYWDLYTRIFDQVFCLPSNSTDIVTIVSSTWKHLRGCFVFLISTIDLECERENTARIWEVKK